MNQWRELTSRGPHTSPRWTRKSNRVFILQVLKLPIEKHKTVPKMPGYSVCHAIDLCIVLGTFKRGAVLLDCENFGPSTAEGEGDGIASHSSKTVNEYFLMWMCPLGQKLGDLAWLI